MKNKERETVAGRVGVLESTLLSDLRELGRVLGGSR